MYQWQPSKWMKVLPVGAGLPWVCAALFNTSSLVDDVNARATAAAGNWAKVQMDGRDATLTGTAPGQEAVDAAVKAVVGTYGVRLADASGIKIEAPKPLDPPTVESLTTEQDMPVIKGTWPEGVAKTLDVTVNGKTYSLGKDPELTSASGAWTLKPAAAIAAGAYDVTATVGDGAKMSAAAVAPGKLVISAPAATAAAPIAPTLALPTVAAATADAVWPYAISGTWPEEKAKALELTLADKTYALGQTKELISDGHGTYTFLPSADLKPGKYDLGVNVTAPDGSVAKTILPAAVIVAAAAAPAPAPAPIPLPALTAPTVDHVAVEAGKPVALTGTWKVGEGSSLNVAVNGANYQLGKQTNLLTDSNGKWTLKLADGLPEGKYNVRAVVSASGNRVKGDGGTEELVVTAAAAAPAPAPKPAPLPDLTAPTVDHVKIEGGKPVVVTGTWKIGEGSALNVAVNGVNYQLGKSTNLLTNTAGKWTLTLPDAPAAGTYNVRAVVSASGNRVKGDGSKDELVVTAPPPAPKVEAPKAEAAKPLAAPTVEASKSDSDHPVVKGTWPLGVAKALTVELDGVTHKLGKDYDLLTDTAGHWTLKPTKPVVNGTYNVIATATGADGKSVTDATKGELTVAVAAPPPAPPAAQGYDCEATLARIAAVFPVRFAFNHDDLDVQHALAVNQYAALLKDPRCVAVKMQVAGHADFIGSEAYNQGLSERRAKTVIDTLVKAGVDVGRLTPVGFSKDKPIDPAKSDDARAKNRRAEFTVTK